MTTFKFGNRYVNIDRIVLAEYGSEANVMQSAHPVRECGDDTAPRHSVRLTLEGLPDVLEISDPTELASVVSLLESSRLRDF